MKKRKNYRELLVTMVAVMMALLFFGLAQAQDAIEVDIQSDGITATQLSIPHYRYMKLRIAGPDGRLVCNLASEEESLFWEPAAEAPDGRYRYEMVVLTYDPALDSGNKGDGPSGEGIIRKHGGFRVEGGMIIVPEPPVEDMQQQGRWQGIKKTLMLVLTKVGDFLVPSAEAANLTAQGTLPTVYFDDTDDEDYTPGYDWSIRTEGGADDHDTDNTFQILGSSESSYGNITIIELRNDGTTGTNSSENSMLVDYNGDIDLAVGAVYIDRSMGYVGIGKSTGLGEELTVSGYTPEIALYSEHDSKTMNLQYWDGVFTIEGYNLEQNIFNVHGDAPEDAMTIQSSGYVTLYRVWDHTGGDGLTSLLTMTANNTNATKVSDVGFSLVNERENFRWNFRTAEGSNTGFMITKANTGGPEMVLKNSSTDHTQVIMELGNGAWCDGTWHNGCSRTLKKDIKPLGTEEALEAFRQLEPVTYVYKAQPADPKVGFIAEDMPDLVADPGKKSISSVDLVAVLTKVVQEQQKELEALKADNQALRAEFQQKMALLERQLKAFTSVALAK